MKMTILESINKLRLIESIDLIESAESVLSNIRVVLSHNKLASLTAITQGLGDEARAVSLISEFLAGIETIVNANGGKNKEVVIRILAAANAKTNDSAVAKIIGVGQRVPALADTWTTLITQYEEALASGDTAVSNKTKAQITANIHRLETKIRMLVGSSSQKLTTSPQFA